MHILSDKLEDKTIVGCRNFELLPIDLVGVLASAFPKDTILDAANLAFSPIHEILKRDCAFIVIFSASDYGTRRVRNGEE